MIVDVLGICAGTWGVVMAIAPGMQLRKMVRTRTAADVSMSFFGLLLPGYVLWVSYGVARGDPALIVPNAVAFCMGVATMLVARYFRKNPGGEAAAPQRAELDASSA